MSNQKPEIREENNFMKPTREDYIILFDMIVNEYDSSIKNDYIIMDDYKILIDNCECYYVFDKYNQWKKGYIWIKIAVINVSSCECVPEDAICFHNSFKQDLDKFINLIEHIHSLWDK